MSFIPNRPTSGAFEKAFEAWLCQAHNEDDNSDVDDVLLIEPPNHRTNNTSKDSSKLSPISSGESSTSYPSVDRPESPFIKRQHLVTRQRKYLCAQRYHAYKAVLKKYSRHRRVACKKSFSPGSLTDDSGVVSPGCDASMGILKDVMMEESNDCVSGDDSPPNIQDDFTSEHGWSAGMSYPQRLDSECHDHPPELIPSHSVMDTTSVLQDQVTHEDTQLSQSVYDSVHPPFQSDMERSSERDVMCNSLLDKYSFSKESRRSSKSRKHLSPRLSTGRHKTMRTNGCHKLDSPSQTSVDAGLPSHSGDSALLGKKQDALCIKRALSGGVDCDTVSYVSRNGCEIGASDSGAGSQSESCCEESPRHDHDNLVLTGHTKTKSPQFSCDSHRFTVIPSYNTNKTSSSGSPPLLLKLKKCELKSNVKNSPPKYVAIDVINTCEKQIKKFKPDEVEKEVFHHHSNEADIGGVAAASRSKRSKSVKKSSSACQCCVGSRSSTRRKRHTRSVSDCSVVLPGRCSRGVITSHERKFIRQSSHLSSLQTKVHTLFCHLFPLLQSVLSQVSPEGRNFGRMVDDVICLLQQAETNDDLKDSEELSGELEHLTLKGGKSVEPVFDPCVVLCRSPGLCLEEFREKVFLLVQLLLPELTLTMENNCYRSHRELEKFLDKVIHLNRTNV